MSCRFLGQWPNIVHHALGRSGWYYLSATNNAPPLEAQPGLNSNMTLFVSSFLNPLKSKTVCVCVLCLSWSCSTLPPSCFVKFSGMSFLFRKLKTLKSRIFISCMSLSPHSTQCVFQFKVSIRTLDA